MKIAQMEFGDMTKKPPEAQNLTMSEIEFVITHAALIEKWIAAVYAEAMKLLLKGKKSKVLKLVHGRTVRYWSDDQQVIKILKKMKFDEDEITPRSLLGVAKIIHAFKRRLAEKGLRGKAAQAQLPKVMKSLLPLIQVKEPGLHVAHIDDKRPAVKRGEEFLAAPIAEKKNTPTAAKKTVKKTRKA